MTGCRLEVCVDDATGVDAAVAGGADRIELCAALATGGLTPPPGLMAYAAQAPVPSYAMIRPRAGSFVFDAGEIDIMRWDIDAARTAGLAGVVLGANLPDGRLDAECLRQLAHHADSLGLTLHRAFDLVPDFRDAVDLAVDISCERILTSGGAKTALEGIETLAEIVEHAAGRISIMPGSGVSLANADLLRQRLGVTELHSSCSIVVREEDKRLVSLGFAGKSTRRTDAATVRALKESLRG
ncbi:copper homeostasis protein [Pararhizobium capsulatum DSM 1112]|uniref:PF03932 family protein CutC n=1 Tax=Pararhizobium capsulatum DSM 1112 TaxID=1121113 RepID=A0ABU0BJ79_9HYPH|nr:copper homeostasis protein CutC [Pararhizobium capsulatum]MDQ0318310.1 copper homeostasis protein [Pararhizobium capsulatum DSM 1112]